MLKVDSRRWQSKARRGGGGGVQHAQSSCACFCSKRILGRALQGEGRREDRGLGRDGDSGSRRVCSRQLLRNCRRQRIDPSWGALLLPPHPTRVSALFSVASSRTSRLLLDTPPIPANPPPFLRHWRRLSTIAFPLPPLSPALSPSYTRSSLHHYTRSDRHGVFRH